MAPQKSLNVTKRSFFFCPHFQATDRIFWKTPPTVEIFTKTPLHHLCEYRTAGFIGLSSVFDVIFCVWCSFVQTYLRMQQRINAWQKPNSAVFIVSRRDFYVQMYIFR